MAKHGVQSFAMNDLIASRAESLKTFCIRNLYSVLEKKNESPDFLHCYFRFQNKKGLKMYGV